MSGNPDENPYAAYFGKECFSDTLVYSEEYQFCLLKCIFAFYSDKEFLALEIIDGTLAVIGFLLAYFYCMTSLFRPIMLKFPNSNYFFYFLSAGLGSIAQLIPLFLGSRYVFCDSAYEPGHSNWACVINGN